MMAFVAALTRCCAYINAHFTLCPMVVPSFQQCNIIYFFCYDHPCCERGFSNGLARDVARCCPSREYKYVQLWRSRALKENRESNERKHRME